MASTVLASRLPSTAHVFSLTLFSIEVFGLFPIFRRELRARSWRGHLTLTIVLVTAAWGGVFVTLTGGGKELREQRETGHEQEPGGRRHGRVELVADRAAEVQK